jgi:hypothetical protein
MTSISFLVVMLELPNYSSEIPLFVTGEVVPLHREMELDKERVNFD